MQRASILNMNVDVWLKILMYLDPISLIFLSWTSKFFRKLEMSISFLNKHGQEQSLILPHDITLKIFTQLFGPNYHNIHLKKGLSNAEKKCFILVRANDLYTIKHSKLDFTLAILDKKDGKNKTLLSLIREKNNDELSEYIFKKIYNGYGRKGYKREHMILCAAQLDQATESVSNLLTKHLLEIKKSDIENYPVLWMSYAIAYNSPKFVSLLLKLNANPNGVYERMTHLYYAAQEGRFEIVKLLLNSGADINALSEGKSILCIAAENGYLNIVKLLVEKGADVDFQYDVNGVFPLYLAMYKGRLDVVDFLLEKGAKINLKYNGFSPLYIAAKNNHLAAVQALLTHCQKNRGYLNINEINGDIENYGTALCAAAHESHADMVKLLLDSGADIDNEHMEGVTPLYVAATNGHNEIVKMLRQHTEQPNYNRVLHDSSTPLYVAAQNGHSDVVDLLCKQGCDVDIVFDGGYTPLHAVCAFHTDHNCDALMPIIISLIKAGANPSPLNYKNETPASFVQEGEIKEMLLLLGHLYKKISLLSRMPYKSIIDKHTIDVHSIFKTIEAFITDQDSKGNASEIQARLCLKYLSSTFTSFGCAVVLYSLLSESKHKNTLLFKNNPTDFIACVIKALDCKTRIEARSFLSLIILSHIEGKKELFDQLGHVVIGPINSIFNNQAQLTSHAYNTVMLCLNLFEAKIKQLYGLTNSREQEKTVAEVELNPIGYHNGR